MRCDLLDYDLPDDRIARRPEGSREAARLLVVEPSLPGGLAHHHIRDLPHLLPTGALLVVNDTRVIPARLLGKKAGTGGAVELLLVRPLAPEASATETATYLAMGRASKPLRPGTVVHFGDGDLTARIDARGAAPAAEAGAPAAEAGALLTVTLSAKGGDVASTLERLGHVPLPPYLRRADDAEDRARYQTVYARVPGAIAAPTAGLHLSQALLDQFSDRGIERTAVTLHVGLGTFQPVTAPDLDEHPMHSESFEVQTETSDAIARARARNAPIIAVGTTVVRALESAADPDRPGHVRAQRGDTRLLIQPGYTFRVVDRLLTNFHLPRSTLLALVYAFAGRDRVRRAYATAIAEGYRFYSYGDAMLLRRDTEVTA